MVAHGCMSLFIVGLFHNLVISRGQIYFDDAVIKCYGIECQNNGTLDNETCGCNCSEEFTGPFCDTERHETHFPRGYYALPTTLHGCPEDETAYQWYTGFINLTMNGSYDINVQNKSDHRYTRHYWTDDAHFLGPYHRRTVQLNFCIRMDTPRDVDSDQNWPQGNYCVYKITEQCPAGFKGGKIALKDYSVINEQYDGRIPLTQSGTVILAFCCRQHNETTVAIAFGNKTSDFYLFKTMESEGCQDILRMKSTEEKFSFRKNSNTTWNKSGVLPSFQEDAKFFNLSFCYYHPVVRRECKEKIDKGSSYRGTQNTTKQGPCDMWDSATVKDTRYEGDFEHNYCRTLQASAVPECSVNGILVGCHWIPFCEDKDFEDLVNYAYLKQVKSPAGFPYNPSGEVLPQTVQFKNQQLVVNGKVPSNANFKITTPYEEPYFMIDLGFTHEITAVFIYKNIHHKEDPDSFWQRMVVWVGQREWDFLTFGAYMCGERLNAYKSSKILYRCQRSISGRYVTVQTNVYSDPDLVGEDHLNLQVSDIAVYGKATVCGRKLGVTTGKIERAQITIAGSDKIYTNTDAFSTSEGLCPTPQSNVESIKIYLVLPMLIQGLVVEINPKISKPLKSKLRFSVSYGFEHETNTRTNYSDITAKRKIFELSDKSDYVNGQTILFNDPFVASIVEINFEDSQDEDSKPCFKVDLIVCERSVSLECTFGQEQIGWKTTFDHTMVNGSIAEPPIVQNWQKCFEQCLENTECQTIIYNKDTKTCNQAAQLSYPPFFTYPGSESGAREESVTERFCIAEVPIQDCHYKFTSEAMIFSPKYPAPYGDHLKCMWEFKFPKNVAILVSVIDFDIRPETNDTESVGASVSKDGQCSDEVHLVRTDGRDVLKATSIAVLRNVSFPIISNRVNITFASCEITKKMVYRGFALKIHTLDCPVCIWEKTMEFCHNKCGYIQSKYFPTLSFEGEHNVNSHTTYELKAKFFQYLKLVMLHYDWPDDEKLVVKEYSPQESFVHVWKIPEDPYYVYRCVSSRARVIVPAFTSPVYRGVQIKYTFLAIQGYGSKWKYLREEGCKENWVYLEGSCYRVVRIERGTFSDARRACNNMGSDLAKITSIRESKAVHYYLLSKKDNLDPNIVVIGLQSLFKQKMFKWLDGSRAIFQNWQTMWSTRGPIRHQEYITVDGCVVLHITTAQNSASWINQRCRSDYELALCEINIEEKAKRNTSRADIKVTATSFIPTNKVLFACRNKVLIDIASRCDGINDCFDNSDEQRCDNVKPIATCRGDEYQCHDGKQCIPVSRYCDHINDCQDQSDERFCEHPACTIMEFRCKNGQCINYLERCDLKVDCLDGTDEENCDNVDCSSNKSLFPCSKTIHCIPKDRVCDGFVDCPGKKKTDETRCEGSHVKATCKDWYVEGYKLSGTYYIHLGIERSNGKYDRFRVECEFDEVTGTVSTVFHHTNQASIQYRNLRDRMQLHYDTKFGRFNPQTLEKKYSMECTQRLEVECYHTEYIESALIIHGGSEKNNCTVYSTCVDQHSAPLCRNPGRCKCLLGKHDWYRTSRTDVFKDVFILDNAKILPIRHFYNDRPSGNFAFTNVAIGPLVCNTSMTTKNRNIRCNTGLVVSHEHRCLYNLDKYGYATGCRDNTHLLDCENWACPSGYAKCPNDFCIPIDFICDGKTDCVRGEDEMDCESWFCPNQFRCRNSTICLSNTKLCDGIRDCQFGDDEVNCEINCPESCTCSSAFTDCSGININNRIFTGLSQDMRTLVLNRTHVVLAGFKQSPLAKFTYLGKLYLSSCNLHHISNLVFKNLKNLFHLDLSYNKITSISAILFRDLLNLRFLNLKGNRDLYTIQVNAFVNLKYLGRLDLHDLSLTTVSQGMLRGLDSLEILNLSGNSLSSAEDHSFFSLRNLRILDISRNKISSFGESLFDGLESIESLFTDSFLFCCIKPTNLSISKCFPSPDEFSSCSDLLRSEIVRACLWLIGSMAFFGNIFSFIFRLMSEHDTLQSGYGVLVTNLTVADMIMGMYLLMISSADSLYRGRYIWNDYFWRHSFGCTFAGVLGMLSVECSVLILTLITFDRFKSIKFNSGFTKSVSISLGSVAWLLSVIVAVLPILPVTPLESYFGNSFYSVSGVCLTLPLTSRNIRGLGYSAGILIVFNFICFVSIAVGQTFVYVTVRRTKLMLESPDRRVEFQIAKRLSTVVITDFIAWFPVCVLGIHTLMGGEVSGVVYTWIAVFVLPFNAALNPIIYTYSSFSNSELGRKILDRLGFQTARFSTQSQVSFYKTRVHAMYRSGGVALCQQKQHVQIRQLFTGDGNVALLTVLDITCHLASVIDALHAANLSVSRFNEDQLTVFLEGNRGSIKVVIRGIPRASQNEADKATNILDVGQVVAWMLKRYNIQKLRNVDKAARKN